MSIREKIKDEAKTCGSTAKAIVLYGLDKKKPLPKWVLLDDVQKVLDGYEQKLQELANLFKTRVKYLDEGNQVVDDYEEFLESVEAKIAELTKTEQREK